MSSTVKLDPTAREQLLGILARGGTQVDAAALLDMSATVLSHSICADGELHSAVAEARREGAKVKAAKPKPPPKPKPVKVATTPPPAWRVEKDTRPWVAPATLDAMLEHAHAAAQTLFESKMKGKGKPRFPLPPNWGECRKLIHGISDAAERAGAILSLLDELAGRASDEAGLAWNRTG